MEVSFKTSLALVSIAAFVAFLLLLRGDDTDSKSVVAIVVIFLLLLWWIFRRRRRPALNVSKLMEATAEEMIQYQLIFEKVDADRSGHVTTTELLKAFQELNVSPRGERAQRQVSFLDVEKLRKKVDVDKNILIEFDEFVNLIQLEKLDFAEKLLREEDAKGRKDVDLDVVLTSLKRAGFSVDEDWETFVKRYNHNDTSDKPSIDFQHLLQSLEATVTPKQ